MLCSPVFCASITSRISYQASRASFNLVRNCLFNRSFSDRNTQTKQQEEDVHFFGFEKVSSSEKRQRVQSVFSNVAAKYDLMNDIMSGGIHRFWKDYFIHTLAPTAGTKLLDVAGGTGDIAFRFLKAVENRSPEFSEIQDHPESHVTVLDISANMLSICKTRAEEAGACNSLTCIQGNAEKLPFADNTFDAYTIAFGIRNVVHIEEALTEALRVLRPGGRFLCLEFSEVRNPTFNRMYHWYSQEIIPVLGELVAGDWKSYQYLVESIQKFPNQEDFGQMIKEAGFRAVTHENLFNGIAAIHSAYKL
ncbi:2-methoxy-6-polyprenyl-1,4-benzoquinol methylase, mitochondrial [Araneus ventricosus]|uniref:2-methoxy-6-polyprenyl-1,4-benzoquinol methylase, mitochondrial n=1 Tax=Araneus ventricosus TaxID=182803 RepID=A0A4Y2CDJ5_ARAVE|nr:2-methoxy-6-polyprenyl-1,4-benzoquinol methylase, mitochondrial [Araneus ventricosus]